MRETLLNPQSDIRSEATMESKNGKYASVILDGEMIKSWRCDGAWDLARKLAESHLLKREQLEQEGWVIA